MAAENLGRRSRDQNSEYLAQRRKACPEQRRRGRKEIGLPDLAFLASWREQIPVLDSHGPPEICASSENFNVQQRLYRISFLAYFLVRFFRPKVGFRPKQE